MNSAPERPNLDFARKLIQHCCWEDQRVWRLALKPLSDEQFTRDLPFGSGSIQRECLRIIETESACLWRVRGASYAAGEDGRHAFDRAAMWARWSEIHRAWNQFAVELDASAVFSDCAVSHAGGEATLTAWQMIVDMIYQGSTRRSDIMRMVAAVHRAPDFDLSLMQYLTGVFRG